jgi:hypothetical protein
MSGTSRLAIGVIRILAAVAALGCAGAASAQYAPGTNPYYCKIPGVTGFYSSTAASTFAGATDSTGASIYWQYSPEAMMSLSLSGLAAKAALAGSNTELVWVNMQNYPYAYGYARNDLYTLKHLTGLGTKTPWQLVDIYKAKGIVKGFVVYHYETGSRQPWNGGPFDASINVATVYAHQLDAIIIEEGQIATALAHGLVQLADCRGVSQDTAWATYQASIDRSAVVSVDPKVPWNRDYAVATGCFAVFPLDPASPNQVSSFYRNTLLPAMNPNFPVLGWPGGDEYDHTQAATVRSGFNTATSFDCNLFVHSQLTPGVDDSIDNYRVNTKSAVDLTKLVWAKKDVHYTAMIMSDGDSFALANTYVDDAASAWGEFYGHPDRGLFPFTWGIPAADLYQTMPSTLRVLGQWATANDHFIQTGIGYFYPDLYPALASHVQQVDPILDQVRIRTYLGLFSDLGSNSTRTALDTVAANLGGLAGIFTMDYSPYTEGAGQVSWVKNTQGRDIPALAAKHAVWSNSGFANEGTGPEVAQFVNAAAHTGPLTTADYFDWTVIHVWSFFDDCADMNQSGATFNRAAGIERAYASAKCMFLNLAPHVRVVTAEELAWQTALHLRTGEALNRVYDMAESELSSGSQSLAEKQVLAQQIALGRSALLTTGTAPTSVADIDLGSTQRAPYGAPSAGGFTVTANSMEQSADGSPSTKFQVSTGYAFTNMSFPTLDVAANGGTLEYDIYGDGSGSSIRFEFYSLARSAFAYIDVPLNFVGWRHHSWKLDGSNGLLAFGATLPQILSSIDIWQVSGSWNAVAATFHLDNVRVMSTVIEPAISTDEDLKYSQFMLAQDRLKAVRSGNALHDLDESFDTLNAGALPQDGWIDSAGTPTISAARAYSGNRSLKLAGSDTVEKLVYLAPGPTAQFTAQLYMENWATLTSRILLEPGIGELAFSALGITAVEGDGAGGTVSTPIAGTYAAAQWHSVGVTMDYGAKRWAVSVDGVGKIQNLRFKDSAADTLLGVRFEGDQFVDDVTAGNATARVADYELY